jgi:hypothetical protein
MGELILNLTKYKFKKPTVSVENNAVLWQV